MEGCPAGIATLGEEGCSLERIFDSILNSFPNLNAFSETEVILVWKKRRSADYRSVHPFHVVVWMDQDSNPTVQLVSYNGRLVESEKIEFRDGKLNSGLLDRFDRDQVSLCQGVDDDTDLDRIGLSQVVLDFLNDSIFVRSRFCSLAVSRDVKTCQFCHEMTNDLKSNISTKLSTPVTLLNTSNSSAFIKNIISDHLQDKMKYSKSKSFLDNLDAVVREGNISIVENCDYSPIKSQITKVESKTTRTRKVQDYPKEKRQVQDYPRQKRKVVKKVAKSKETKDNEAAMRQCQICLFKHNKSHIFDKHYETHLQRYDLNSPVTCPVCQKTFSSKYELNPHFQEVHDKDKGCCIECQVIVEWPKLKRHLTYAHFILPKNKLCPNCGEAFKNSQDLEIHIAVHHDRNTESCICDHCGKIFPHPKLLAKHIQTQHINNNKGLFKCPFCDKIFDKSHAWHKHLKIHSKIKPYKCGWCEYRSVNRFNVRLHMRKRHKDDASYLDLIKEGSFDFGVNQKLELEAFKVK